MKKILLLVGQSGIGAVLLYLFFRTVNLKDFMHYSSRISFGWVVWAVIAYLLAVLLRVGRFLVLIKPIKKMRFLDTAAFSFAGTLLNYMIPLRAGEVGRGWFMKRKYGISLISGTTISFIDKLFDLLASVIFIFILVPITQRLSLFQHVSLIEIFLLVLFLLLVFSFAFRGKQLLVVLKSFHIVYELFDKIMEGTVVLRLRPVVLFRVIFLSILALLSDGMSVYFLYLSFGAFLPLWVVMLGYTIFNLSFLIPAGPGYVGNIEFLGVFIFSHLLGLPRNVTVSAVLYFHFVITFILAVFGFASLAYLHFDMKKWRLGLLRSV